MHTRTWMPILIGTMRRMVMLRAVACAIAGVCVGFGVVMVSLVLTMMLMTMTMATRSLTTTTMPARASDDDGDYGKDDVDDGVDLGINVEFGTDGAARTTPLGAQPSATNPRRKQHLNSTKRANTGWQEFTGSGSA